MKTKFAQICIIGKPNAGKSTLMNHLIKHKLSIVTPKVQTTRSKITGIITLKDTQLVFLDTPGIFTPAKKLEKAMVRCAWSSIVGCDFVILVIDATMEFDDKLKEVINHLKANKISPIIAFNKNDLVSPEKIQKQKTEVEKFINFSHSYNISALRGDNCAKLLDYLVVNAPEGNWVYEEDDLTTLPMRFLASEITREQLFFNLDQELPYNLTVETEKWEDKPDGSALVHQVIYVTKDNHKMIILGSKGEMIKKIGIAARKNIEQDLNIKVHLYIFVKVRENWDSDPHLYSYMGLKLKE